MALLFIRGRQRGQIVVVALLERQRDNNARGMTFTKGPLGSTWSRSEGERLLVYKNAPILALFFPAEETDSITTIFILFGLFPYILSDFLSVLWKFVVNIVCFRISEA